MRKSFTSILVASLVASASTPLLAQQNAAFNGPAPAAAAERVPAPGFRVNVRNADTVELAAETTARRPGQFSFPSLQAGIYVVEIADAAGNTVGLSPALPLATGSTVTVTVGAAAAGALSAGGGPELLGLGSLASVAVAGSTTAVVAATRAGRLTVCHKLAEAEYQTLEIRDAARTSHMGHGDMLGACLPDSPR